MIYLETDVGTFGPFLSAAELDDGWLCDGIMYPRTVVGNATIVFAKHAPEPDPTEELPPEGE